MEFKSPECNYCHQTYSRFNEPILIVCLCDHVVKYAHGSCFRDFLRKFDYGVCDTCFTRTKIVPDGYKSISNWKVIWRPLRGFWRRFKTDNRYWKVVYVREEMNTGRKTPTKSIRYEDVPLEKPWTNDPVHEEEPEESIEFEVPGFQECPVKKEPGSDEDEETPDGGFCLPVVFKPRGYPFVKRNKSDDHLSPTDSAFDYYPTWSNRGSFDSIGKRNIYTDTNSIYTVTTIGTNDSSTSRSAANSDGEEEDESDQRKQSESKFFSIGRQFLKKFTSETAEDTIPPRRTKRKPSNNNTMQQVYTITESNLETDIAILPFENDIIYMQDDNKSTSQTHNNEDFWRMNHKNDDVIVSSSATIQNGKKSKKTENLSARQLYGVSKMAKPVVRNTPEPALSKVDNKTSTGIVNSNDTKNIFYAP